MTFRRAIGNPTDRQQEEQDRIRAVGCIACLMRRVGEVNAPLHTPAEIHHITRNGMQMGQEYVLPLCGFHHRSQPFTDTLATAEACRRELGPSLAEGSKAFFAHFGTDQSLLNLVRWMAGLDPVQIPDRAQRKRKGNTRRPEKILRGAA